MHTNPTFNQCSFPTVSFSTIFSLCVFILEFAEPRSRRSMILIRGSDFRSAKCDAWKLETPGVTRSQREYACASLSLITHRIEFIHETYQNRGDYNTGVSQLLGCLGNSKSESCSVQQIQVHLTVCSHPLMYMCSHLSLTALRKLNCKDLNMTSSTQNGIWTIAQLL